MNSTTSTGHRSRLSAVLAGGIAVASVLGMDPGGWFPFGPAKWYAVLLVSVLAIWSEFSQREATSTGLPTTVRRLWIGLLGILVVAAIFGREPIYAWTGTPERNLGVIAWVLFFGCCWLGTRLGRPGDRIVIAKMVTIAALLNGTYCLIELLAGAPLAVDTVGQRIGGPYGSSAFLGAALCLLIPVPLGLAAARSEPTAWRLAAGVATGVGLIALVGSGTRAAFVGVGASTIVAATALMMSRRGSTSPKARPTTKSKTIESKTIESKIVWIVGSSVVAAMVLIGAGAITVGLPERATANAARLGDLGSSSRVDEWGVGVRIVAAHPVLGVGPEGYRTALDDGITPDYERTYGRDVTPDRAHNGLLDVAAAGGILAGLLYGVLLLVCVRSAWQALRHQGPVSAGAAAGVVAYAVQQLFLFPVATIDPVFWMLAGTVLCLARGQLPVRTTPETESRPPDDADGASPQSSARPSLQRGLVDSVAVGVMIVVVASATLAIASDRLARRSTEHQDVSAAQRATALRPDGVRYWLLLERSEPMTITGINNALSAIDKAREVSPGDPVVRRRNAERLLDLAIATGDPNDISRAVDAWSELATDTDCYRCGLGYGYALALDGNVDAAVEAFERASTLAPGDNSEAADNAATLRRSQSQATGEPA